MLDLDGTGILGGKELGDLVDLARHAFPAESNIEMMDEKNEEEKCEIYTKEGEVEEVSMGFLIFAVECQRRCGISSNEAPLSVEGFTYEASSMWATLSSQEQDAYHEVAREAEAESPMDLSEYTDQDLPRGVVEEILGGIQASILLELRRDAAESRRAKRMDMVQARSKQRLSEHDLPSKQRLSEHDLPEDCTEKQPHLNRDNGESLRRGSCLKGGSKKGGGGFDKRDLLLVSMASKATMCDGSEASSQEMDSESFTVGQQSWPSRNKAGGDGMRMARAVRRYNTPVQRKEAESLLRGALAVIEAVEGSTHPSVAARLQELARWLQRHANGIQDEVLDYLGRAAWICEARLGPTHLRTQEAYEELARCVATSRQGGASNGAVKKKILQEIRRKVMHHDTTKRVGTRINWSLDHDNNIENAFGDISREAGAEHGLDVAEEDPDGDYQEMITIEDYMRLSSPHGHMDQDALGKLFI